MISIESISTTTQLANKNHKQMGFTLIELLMVVTLLAILSGLTVLSFDNIQEESRVDIARYEMSELRKALLAFRRDTSEFPCRVYRAGRYNPFTNTGIDQDPLDFTDLPTTPSAANYYDWCKNTLATDQADNALSMLLSFPYDNLDPNFTGLLWNPDTKRGWNGPYINNQGLLDPWGNPYVLLDPELDYRSHFRCLVNSGDYDITGNTYNCITADDGSWNASTFTLNANIARIVSYGPDGLDQSANVVGQCQAGAGSDDIVVCLLQ